MSELGSTARYFDFPHTCLDAANKYIAHGALTNSKRPSSFVEGVYPTHFEKGAMEYAFSVSGSKYVDYLCGLGSNLFGYANPVITETMVKALNRGTSLSLGTPTEAFYAKTFLDKFPHADKIRILKSGSEGCAAALRIARAATGRDLVLTDGYHGWLDEFTSLTPPASGVPTETGYSIAKLRSLEQIDIEVAAVIIEPVILDYSKERKEYLDRLIKACNKAGTVIIFDETITAFRFPGCSVAKYWGLDPDITIQGKALANGMAISVVAGKSGIMDADYFVSSTFSGEQVTLAAAIKCIELISGEYAPENLWDMGAEFIRRMNEAVGPRIEFVGYPTRGAIHGDSTFKGMWCQEMCKMGFFFHPSTWFYSQHLHKHIDDVVDLAGKVTRRINDGYVKLEGYLPQSPFSKKEYQ